MEKPFHKIIGTSTRDFREQCDRRAGNEKTASADQDEIQTAFKRLKNNKAAGANGLQAEPFTTGSGELIRSMHQFIDKFSQKKVCPVIDCSIFKKGDPTVCSNYHGISILSMAYNVLPCRMCERLKP